MAANRPGGFTLIEILVVIAIIAVLVALLLPAVQAAREAARRAQCLNNLVQISVALQNYQVAFDVLPPGSVNQTGPIVENPHGYHYSWIVQILPYMDQKGLQKKFDFTVGLYDAKHDTVRAFVLNSFLCPSDRRSYPTGVKPLGGWVNPTYGLDTPWNNASSLGAAGELAAHSSYMGVHHDVEAPIDVTNNGVLYLNSAVRFEDIEDGLSNTMLVGESIQKKPDLGWASGTRATLRNGGWGVNYNPRNMGAAVVVRNKVGGITIIRGSGAGTNPIVEPVGGFSSFHAGGVNFAFGDGSVRFIKDSVSTQTFTRLCNRSDGEADSADSY